jgi:hypothetical protein
MATAAEDVKRRRAVLAEVERVASASAILPHEYLSMCDHVS